MKQIIKEKGKFAVLLICGIWLFVFTYMVGYHEGRSFYCEQTQKRIEKLEQDKVKIFRYFMYGEEPDGN